MTTAARELFDDLLTLEVNIIVKDGMTARKMPDIPQALLDIFSTYDIYLCKCAAEWNRRWASLRQGDTAAAFLVKAQSDEWLRDTDETVITGLDTGRIFTAEVEVTSDHFDQLRVRARKAEAMYRLQVGEGALDDDGSDIILRRIYRNCDQIKGILGGRNVGRGRKRRTRGISRGTTDAGAVPLTADEVLLVRKAWDLGTEVIAMQTVAQLDGDVVTRVQRARMGPSAKPLHDLHSQAVGDALQHWQFLVTTFVQMTTKAAGFLGR